MSNEYIKKAELLVKITREDYGNDDDANTVQAIITQLNLAESKAAEMEDIVKAVAHIGVDFGYGKYEIEQKYIDAARGYFERKDTPA